MGIISIKLKEPKAKEIMDELAKNYGYKFSKIIDGELNMYFNYDDDDGYKYWTSIFMKASKNNKKIKVYINKKDFANFARADFSYVEEDVIYVVESYINDVYPNIIENGWFF